MDNYNVEKILFNIVIVFLLVFLNAFFVAIEFAIVKVRPSKLMQLENDGETLATFAKNITEKLDSYLSACQLGITLASLGLGWIGEPAVADMLNPIFSAFGVSDVITHTLSFSIAFIIITVFHIVLGELAPKSIAIQKAEKISLYLSLPLILFYRITYPIIWLFNNMSNLILRLLKLEPNTKLHHAHTEEEIRILVDESHKNGLINTTESTLVGNVFQFSDRLAREAMIPRTTATVLYTDIPFEENYKEVLQHRHSRYPVALEDKDNIIGFVHISDFYAEATKPKGKDLNNIIRKILFVPESAVLSSVLKQMQENKILISVVQDEYGGVAGILTLEDIVEEIIGEIHDEFDSHRPLIDMVDDGYSIDGLMLIEDLNNTFDIEISNEEVDTIGGFVHSILEDAPEVGISTVYGDYTFVIEEMDRNRISRIIIKGIAMKSAIPTDDIPSDDNNPENPQ